MNPDHIERIYAGGPITIINGDGSNNIRIPPNRPDIKRQTKTKNSINRNKVIASAAGVLLLLSISKRSSVGDLIQAGLNKVNLGHSEPSDQPHKVLSSAKLTIQQKDVEINVGNVARYVLQHDSTDADGNPNGIEVSKDGNIYVRFGLELNRERFEGISAGSVDPELITPLHFLRTLANSDDPATRQACKKDLAKVVQEIQVHSKSITAGYPNISAADISNADNPYKEGANDPSKPDIYGFIASPFDPTESLVLTCDL